MKTNWLMALGVATLLTGCSKNEEPAQTAEKPRDRYDRNASTALPSPTNNPRGEMENTNNPRSALEITNELVSAARNVASNVDNTARNLRDRAGATLTPMDQSETEADRAITQTLRKSLMADVSLSITAKNIKIITANGVVTLRGPVNNEEEKGAIAEKAKGVAGVQNVVNELEIKSTTAP